MNFLGEYIHRTFFLFMTYNVKTRIKNNQNLCGNDFKIHAQGQVYHFNVSLNISTTFIQILSRFKIADQF